MSQPIPPRTCDSRGLSALSEAIGFEVRYQLLAEGRTRRQYEIDAWLGFARWSFDTEAQAVAWVERQVTYGQIVCPFKCADCGQPSLPVRCTSCLEAINAA